MTIVQRAVLEYGQQRGTLEIAGERKRPDVVPRDALTDFLDFVQKR